MPIAEGAVFAGYTIQRLLGTGGMGEVYLVQHPRLPRQEALKILPANVSADPDYRQRFAREADIAASLWHPHIVAIHDRGEHDGQLWITMDYVDGTDAARLMRDRYPHGMPPKDVLDVVAAIADALDYAHERFLLHRDVKPANILLGDPRNGERRTVLADFGIARGVNDNNGLTATNMTVGSVAYAAPEQLTGKVLDGRADQYALAATAFHLLTGTLPFGNSNPAAVIGNHLTSPPPTLSKLRDDLGQMDSALATAMAKEPHHRFQTCREFAAALAGRGGPSITGSGATAVRPNDATQLAPLTPPIRPETPAPQRVSFPAGAAEAASHTADCRWCRRSAPGHWSRCVPRRETRAVTRGVPYCCPVAVPDPTRMAGDNRTTPHGDARRAAGDRHSAQQPPATRTSRTGARASYSVTTVRRPGSSATDEQTELHRPGNRRPRIGDHARAVPRGRATPPGRASRRLLPSH